MLLVLNYVLRLWGRIARDRRDLVLENIALRHQVDVLTRTRRRPALLLGDRLLWLSLSRTWPAWRKHLVIVQPDTSDPFGVSGDDCPLLRDDRV